MDTSGGTGRWSARSERPSSSRRATSSSWRSTCPAGNEPRTAAGRPPKRSKAQNLLLRLDEREEQALRFAHDFRVPFDINLSERDLRMVKLQQKISGCRRTRDGARAFLTVRSYTSTARKHGQRPLTVLG